MPFEKPSITREPRPTFGRDLAFDDHDFKRIRDLIYQRAGIVITENKKDMVYSRIGRRVRHFQMASFGDYLHYLEKNVGSSEWEEFTNALTTNLTAFFREAHHFPLLAEHAKKKRPEKLRVWSSAASTGQEPYSIAIQLFEALGAQADFHILGTDIDSQALHAAKRGVYPLKQIEKLSDERRRRFFQRGSGKHVGSVRVRPEVVAKVEFKLLNLIEGSWPRMELFDVIFCRNVMIYFDIDTQARILKRFASCLKPDGLLFAGHSESFTYLTTDFRLRGQTVYTLA